MSASYSSPRRLVWLGIALMALGVLGYGGRVALYASDLASQAAALQVPAAPGAHLDMRAARRSVASLNDDLGGLRVLLRPIFPLLPLLKPLPEVGPDLAQGEALLNWAADLAAAGDSVLAGWSPALDGGANLDRAVEPPAQARDRFALARGYLARAATWQARIDIGALTPRTARLVNRAVPLLPLAQLAADGSLAAPDLLGRDAPRSYLIVAQNRDELRATGGFVTAVGLLTLDHGHIGELGFMDSYQVDDLNKLYPPPPDALIRTMRAGMWLFRDANWSPDFPTSARLLADLFATGQGRSIDGVIAVDQTAVQAVVAALSPLAVGADTPETVTGDNLIAYLRESWSPSTTLGGNPARKGFIGHVAKAVQNRLVTGGGDTGRLALNVYDALQKRHIAVWLKDSAASDALAALGWDGAMRTAEPNYLLIVDSNVGFNKANALITSAYQYEVALKPDLSASADLTITYRHGGSAPPVPCVQRVPDAGYSYAELMDMCFWNYARVYVPKGAPLVDATRQPLAGARLLSRVDSSGDAEVLSSEGGRDAFASLIMVDSGGTRDLHYRYDLPQPAAAREADGLAHYRLAWQKQMGAGPAHVQFALALPPGARPDVARVNRVAVPLRDAPGAPGRMTLEFTLDTDIDLDVAFAPGTAP